MNKLNPELLEFGKRLRLLRETRYMTKTELAGQLGVTRRIIYDWENEKHYPKVKELYALGQLLHVPMDYWISPQWRDYIRD